MSKKYKNTNFVKKDVVEFKSVNELNLAVKYAIEPLYTNIKVTGEISNFKISNNNLFATLKDTDSLINIISWGYGFKKQSVVISNGDTVLVDGKITYYPKSGNICLLVNKFEKMGTGSGGLYQEYEQLKQKYNQLGYFANKKPFPKQLDRIGIATSSSGAAIHDILCVLKTNDFHGKIIIKDCIVQGNQSSQSVSESIKLLSEYNDNGKQLDLILITRGGGALEDLISFSSSAVLEAIHACNIFTISAIGHQIDFMLSDFVADLRAPTPSVAGEIISTSQKNNLLEYKKHKSFVEIQMLQMINSKLESYKNKISLLAKSLENPLEKLSNSEAKLEMIQKHINNSVKTSLASVKNNLEKISGILQKYDIQNMLQQGYVVLIKNNRIIDSVTDVKPGQKLKLKMKNGEISVVVAEDNNKHVEY